MQQTRKDGHLQVSRLRFLRRDQRCLLSGLCGNRFAVLGLVNNHLFISSIRKSRSIFQIEKPLFSKKCTKCPSLAVDVAADNRSLGFADCRIEATSAAVFFFLQND